MECESSDTRYNLFALRPTLTAELVDGVSVFGGPTLNLMLAQADAGVDAEDFALFGATALTEADSSVQLALWPGFVAGMRFF